jgi:hypothetical protein
MPAGPMAMNAPLVVAGLLILSGGVWGIVDDAPLTRYWLSLMQAGLIAAWMALGRSPGGLRAVIGLSAIGALAWAGGPRGLDVANAEVAGPDMRPLLTALTTAVALVYGTLKLLRQSAARGGSPASAAASDHGPGARFTLGQLFVVLLLTATLANGVRLHWAHGSTDSAQQESFREGLSAAALTLVSTWAALSSGSLRGTLLAWGLLVSPAIGVALCLAVLGEYARMAGLLGVVFFPLAHLMVIRALGYRLVWPAQSAAHS